MTQDIMTRFVHRMHAAGIIDHAARDRLLESPMPEGVHMQLGIMQALLSVAIGFAEDRLNPDKEKP